MTTHIKWLIEHQVIYMQGIGDIEEEELDYISDKLKHMFNEAEGQKIHIIQDIRLIGKPYMKMGKIKELLGFARNMAGWYLVLDNKSKKNILFPFVSSAVAQILGIKSRRPFQDYQELRSFFARDGTIS